MSNIFNNEFFFNGKTGKLQPYYDDDREPIIDTDDMEDSEEDIIMVGTPNKHKYHD